MSVDPSNNACDKWPATAPFFGGPYPTRTWFRAGNAPCSGTAATRALAEKTKVLQYKKNSARLTQKQKWAQFAKGKSQYKKQSWASQTQTVTNPNVSNLRQTSDTTLLCCKNITIITPSDLPTTLVGSNYTLNIDYTIPECYELIIPDGISLTVRDNIILTNNGTITINGAGGFYMLTGGILNNKYKLNNNRILQLINTSTTLNNSGIITNNYELINEDGPIINNTGNIINNNTIYNYSFNNPTINNAGKITNNDTVYNANISGNGTINNTGGCWVGSTVTDYLGFGLGTVIGGYPSC